MSNDSQTQKLLFSILSQKCLKDIKWQKVADDLGIESAHAARMRYSRFKDYMNGKSPSKRARRSSTSSPRKPRVSGNLRTPKKVKKEKAAETGGNIKTEMDDRSGAVGVKSEPTEDIDMGEEDQQHETLMSPTPTPAPCSQPQTPFPSELQLQFQSSTQSSILPNLDMSEMNNFDTATSFDMRHSEDRDFETRFFEMHGSPDPIVMGKNSVLGKGIKVENEGWWEDEGSWKC